MGKARLICLTRLQRQSEHKFLSQVQNMLSFFTDLSLHGILGPSVCKTGTVFALISTYFNRKCTEIELLDFEFTTNLEPSKKPKFLGRLQDNLKKISPSVSTQLL